jgi:ATP-dependent Clp protease ATP-binding subunit ClpA
MNGYNFTERVRKVLALSREESARLHHEYVGTEHLLLGLIREGEGVGATVLQNLDVNLDELQDRIEEIVKKGNASVVAGPDLPYTSRAKKVLELAMGQASDMKHRYVGTEHLLLGLIEEEKGIAAQLLADLGVTLGLAREETGRILGTEMPREQPAGLERFVRQRAVRRRPKWTTVMGVVTSALPERLRVVFSGGQDVAAESGSAEFLPIHLAIALVQHGEGLANAVLDQLGCDRPSLLGALESIATRDAPPATPEQVVKVGEPMIALLEQTDAETREGSSSQPNTLHVLLALLETSAEIAAIFETQGLTANRVRVEAERLSG